MDEENKKETSYLFSCHRKHYLHRETKGRTIGRRGRTVSPSTDFLDISPNLFTSRPQHLTDLFSHPQTQQAACCNTQKWIKPCC